MRKKLMFISLTVLIALSGCNSLAGSPTASPSSSPVAQVMTPTQSPSASAFSAGQKEPPPITYAFTQAGQHPDMLLVDVINSAKTSLDIAIYSITYPEIVKAIKEAKKRGVVVRIITDRTEAAGKTQSEALKLLANDKIPIKQNTHKGLMHLKVTIADQSVFTTGSYNYSAAATTTNDEVLLRISDPAMAKEWDAQFERMWNDTKNFEVIK